MTRMSTDALGRELAAMQRAGQGLWRLALFDCRGLVDLMAVPRRELDPHSRAVVETVGRVLRGEVTECLLCGQAFRLFGRMPLAIVVMTAMVDAPGTAFSFCVCEDCHVEPQADMAGVVLAFLREHIVTDLRVLPPIHADGGRA